MFFSEAMARHYHENEDKEEAQRLADKKFEDFIQGIDEPDSEEPNKDWLDNVASAMVTTRDDKEKR
ncbi:hypothetical protein [Lactiplantibacillus plantarum]